MAGSATAPITYSTSATKVQPLDWNAAWAAIAAAFSTTTLKVDHIQEKTGAHGVIFDHTPAASTIKVDHLTENTGGHGIVLDNTVEGVTAKFDHIGEKNSAHNIVLDNTLQGTLIKVDHLAEQTGAHGIIFDNTTSTTTAKIDHIAEQTSSHGIVFDNTPSTTILKVDHLKEQTGSHNILVDNTTRFGDDTNYCQVTNGGVITYGGTAKRHLAIRPSFVAGRLGGIAKPTPAVLGAWAGYSCPIFNNDDEELFWRLHVPGRWDGASDVTYNLIVCLASEETEGDDFKFQLSWNHSDETAGALTADVTSPTADGDCTAGHTAQYSIFRLAFTLDWDVNTPRVLEVGHILAGRVRRIASGGTEVAGEIIVLDHYLNFVVDKVFKE